MRAAVPGHVPGPCPGRARGPVPGPCRASPARARPVPGARAECRARAGPRGPCPARARGPVPSAVPRAGPVPGRVPGAHLPCRNPRPRRPRPPSRGRTVVQGPVRRWVQGLTNDNSDIRHPLLIQTGQAMATIENLRLLAVCSYAVFTIAVSLVACVDPVGSRWHNKLTQCIYSFPQRVVWPTMRQLCGRQTQKRTAEFSRWLCEEPNVVLQIFYLMFVCGGYGTVVVFAYPCWRRSKYAQTEIIWDL